MDSTRGSSAAEAIIINAESSRIGIVAEYAYIEQVCGKKHVDFVLERQTQTSIDGRDYDVLTIRLKDGSQKEFWFDITSFFGE